MNDGDGTGRRRTDSRGAPGTEGVNGSSAPPPTSPASLGAPGWRSRERSCAAKRTLGMRPLALSVLVALQLVLAAPLASSKGITFSIHTSPDRPTVGELVQITVRGASEIPGEPTPDCVGMRVLAVSPTATVRRALSVVEGQRIPGRIGRWRAFRLGSLRRTDGDTWVARLRPNAPGRWMLVIPNWCAFGYVLPEGVLQHQLMVTTTGLTSPFTKGSVPSGGLPIFVATQ